jgi:hypothetical protein
VKINIIKKADDMNNNNDVASKMDCSEPPRSRKRPAPVNGISKSKNGKKLSSDDEK